MILIDRYIEFLVENQLTQDQYLLLHLLKENRADLITRYKNAFPNEEGTMIGKELITDLIAKDDISRWFKSLTKKIEVNETI